MAELSEELIAALIDLDNSVVDYLEGFPLPLEHQHLDTQRMIRDIYTVMLIADDLSGGAISGA